MPLTADALAARIETDFRTLWQQRRGVDPGPDAASERELLFLAVARGVLNYLESEQNQMFNTIRLQPQGSSTTAVTYRVLELDLNKTP
jgi:hypothetical protein